MEPEGVAYVPGRVLPLAILVAVLGLVYAAYRRHRNRMLAEERLERKRRHREQQEVWERMLADTAGERRATSDDPPNRVEA